MWLFLWTLSFNFALWSYLQSFVDGGGSWEFLLRYFFPVPILSPAQFRLHMLKRKGAGKALLG